MANRNQRISREFMKGGQSVDVKRDVSDAIREAVRKTHPGQDIDLATGSETMRAFPSPTLGAPSQSRPFVQKNRNLETGAQTILEMGSAPSYAAMEEAEKAQVRSKCAQFCKQQGRSSCVYCHGKGFAAMGVPSKNVNKSVDVAPKSNSSEFRKA